MGRALTWDPDIKEIHRLYCEEMYSTTEIAKQYGLYQPNGAVDSAKVQRFLMRHNIPLRSKSDARHLSLAMGISEHPTEGSD